ncbi:hypothetical protein TWF730_008516 [Orbilia blumenaviensis]|uniref:F-box domain-containing protein n=1 Tax=Orbilia blumenaviensis TaxID=1796055 RepID=A0AAV9V5P3_9PEZI
MASQNIDKPICPLSSLPAELHIEILSHLPSLTDQISASIAYDLWKTLISTTECLKRLRYTYRRPWKQEGLHHLLSPSQYHTFFGLTAKAGKIISYNLYKFDRRHEEWHTALGYKVNYRNRHSHRYIGKRVYEDDDEDIGVNRRDFTNFQKLVWEVDISDLGIVDEPLVSPYLHEDVVEGVWTRPLDFSYMNDTPEWTTLGQMVLEGFPVVVGTTECTDYRDFYAFAAPGPISLTGFTLRRLAELVVEELGKKIPGQVRGAWSLGREASARYPDLSEGVMKSEKMDPEKEHVILLDEIWYRPEYTTAGRMGISARIMPSDEEERVNVIDRIKWRRGELHLYHGNFGYAPRMRPQEDTT